LYAQETHADTASKEEYALKHHKTNVPPCLLLASASTEPFLDTLDLNIHTVIHTMLEADIIRRIV
jgi:hypothetical protein